MYSSRRDRGRNRGLGGTTVALLKARQASIRKLPVIVTAPVRLLTWGWLLLIGAEIPSGTRIGRNLRLPHGGRGVIVHPASRIGDDVTIYHQVTIGVRGSENDAPVIEDGVYIGAKASILGPVRVGTGARIGAGAVVLEDVPDGATAAGVPARIKRTHEQQRNSNDHDGIDEP